MKKSEVDYPYCQKKIIIKMKVIVNFYVLLFLFFCGTLVECSVPGCWDDWSRCSPSTSGATGILWRGCDSYCKVCFDADGGTCVDSPSKNCPGLLKNNKQCVCTNKRKPKNKWNPTCWA